MDDTDLRHKAACMLCSGKLCGGASAVTKQGRAHSQGLVQVSGLLPRVSGRGSLVCVKQL